MTMLIGYLEHTLHAYFSSKDPPTIMRKYNYIDCFKEDHPVLLLKHIKLLKIFN